MLPMRGELVSLRRWQVSDADAVQRWEQPGQQWRRFNAPFFKTNTAEDIDAIADRIRRSVPKGEDMGGGRSLPVVDARDENRLLGRVSRAQIDETGWTQAGIIVYDPDTWGHGLGSEALRLWIDLLFRTDPELHRLDLRTWSGNIGMIKVAERLGFTLEARYREARLVESVHYDDLGFGMLRSEWPQVGS